VSFLTHFIPLTRHKRGQRLRVRVRMDYLDKIMGVLDFQGFNEVISEIFFTTSEIFYTIYTLDISLEAKYNYTKPNKEVRT
jgi:hypothetical protein